MDVLVEPDRGIGGKGGWIGGDDDSWHPTLLRNLAVMWSARHPLRKRAPLRWRPGRAGGTLPGREEERRQGQQQRSITRSGTEATPVTAQSRMSPSCVRMYARTNITHKSYRDTGLLSRRRL